MPTLTDVRESGDVPPPGRSGERSLAVTRTDDGDGTEPTLSLTRGSMLGRYVLLDAIGSGGMGSVYAAYDPELDRRVALKLLRSEAGQLGRARLVREAQAMAKVSHPNVITVHDVGAFEHGVFVAMELVDGVDLRTWLRSEKRPWREALEVFLAAGRGLAAAHEAGLVHRDFKPANVLRGDDGTIRVVDFGLARRADARPSRQEEGEDDETGGEAKVAPPSEVESASQSVAEAMEISGSQGLLSGSLGTSALISGEVALTHTGAVMGTPAYMAPEQHMRGEIDARTDQFGYCIALYEALYGKRPFSASNPVGLMFEVGRGEIPPPPKGTEVPTRLFAVLRRGLSPDPDDRWPSMSALLAALEHDPWRRRRAWLGGGGAAVIAAVGVWGLAQANAETTEAPCSAAAARMDGVWDDTRRTALTDAFEATALPYATKSATWTSNQLDAWREAWIAEHTNACEDTVVRGVQSEALLDLRMLCLESQRRRASAVVDLFVQADAKVVERANKALEQLPSVARCSDPERLRNAMPLPDDEQTREAIDAVEDELAKARALDSAGRYEDGRAISQAALEHARAIDFPPLLARAQLLDALLQASVGDRQGAVEALHEAARTAALGRADDVLATAWTKLVWHVGLDQSRHDDGLRWGRYADAVLERSGGTDGDFAELEHAIGTVLWAADRLDEALEHLSRSLELRKAIDPDGPLVAHTLVVIGNVEVRRGEAQRALDAFTQARALEVAAYGDEHPLVAIVDNAIGVAHYHLHDLDAAAEAYERAYAVNVRALGSDHPDLLFSLGNIGNIRRDQGRLEEALETMKQVEALVAKAYPPVHRESGMTAHNIGEVLAEMGRHAEALAQYEKALEVREEVHGVDSRYVANTLTGLGETLTALDRRAEALPLLRRALKIREASEPEPKAVSRTQFALARALASGAEARTLAQAARKGLEGIDTEPAERQREAIDEFVRLLD